MTLNIYYNHETGSAKGSLFWDDGESDFEDESGALKSNILLMNYELRNSEISASCFSPEGHSDSSCYFSLDPAGFHTFCKDTVCTSAWLVFMFFS